MVKYKGTHCKQFSWTYWMWRPHFAVDVSYSNYEHSITLVHIIYRNMHADVSVWYDQLISFHVSKTLHARLLLWCWSSSAGICTLRCTYHKRWAVAPLLWHAQNASMHYCHVDDRVSGKLCRICQSLQRQALWAIHITSNTATVYYHRKTLASGLTQVSGISPVNWVVDVLHPAKITTGFNHVPRPVHNTDQCVYARIFSLQKFSLKRHPLAIHVKDSPLHFPANWSLHWYHSAAVHS